LTSARQIIASLPHGRRIENDNENITDVEMGSQEIQAEDLPGVSEALVTFFSDKSTEFSTARKLRGKTQPEGLASVEDITNYTEKNCLDVLHSSGVPGITAMDLQRNLILTGGVDKNVVLFNIKTETIERTFKGHSKRITSVVLHTDQTKFISGAQDSQIRIWTKDEANAKHTITIHDRAVTDISLHPTGDYILSTSDDSHWALSDMSTGRAIAKVKSGEREVGICCSQFHPDGLIFGTGEKDSVVKIWDMRGQANVTNFVGHQGVVRAISFSENGYYLATGAEDGEIKIWDLRRLKNLKTFTTGDEKSPINDLTFDHSGVYLAIASNDVHVYQAKSWSKISQFSSHKGPVTGVRFGEDAKSVVSASMDKTLRIYG